MLAGLRAVTDWRLTATALGVARQIVMYLEPGDLLLGVDVGGRHKAIRFIERAVEQMNLIRQPLGLVRNW